jgi:dihydrolipoamide dehydrogenase
MAETLRPDAVVIGSGPGGYVCAIKLGQLGQKTVIVEREAIGGVCLNWGCIPSKAVIQAADTFEKVRKKAEEMGIAGVAGATLEMKKLSAWKRKIVERLTGNVAQLLKGNKVEILRGEAHFAGSGTALEVKAEGKPAVRLEPRAVVVATGARSFELPGLPTDGKRVLGARGLLDLEEVPARLLVVGGGVIGIELGTAFAKLGSKVTIVELLDTILFGTDPDLSRWVARRLRQLDVEVLLQSKVAGATEGKDGALAVKVTDAQGKNERTLEADKVLVSVGFKPNSAGLGLEDLRVALDGRGHIVVNERLETNVPGIYAIGDVTGPPYLAHRASKQGIVAAEVIAGRNAAFDVRAMPNAIFGDPEIATVGLSEAQAKEQGYTPKIGKFPFSALGKAQIYESPAPGTMKIVADADSGLLLGVHICGHGAADLIGEAALAIEMGATAEDLALTVHPHPTLTEGLMEAAEATVGKPIHLLGGA